MSFICNEYNLQRKCFCRLVHMTWELVIDPFLNNSNHRSVLFSLATFVFIQEGTEDVQQEEPPIKEPTGQNTDSLSQSQPSDKTTRTGTSVIGTVSAIETTFLRV